MRLSSARRIRLWLRAGGVETGVDASAEIAGDFAAKKTARDRVFGVAAQTAAVALLVDVDEERAGVWTIECADGMDGAGHVPFL